MHCPVCHTPETKVIESRIVAEENTVRRRRKCEQCEKRFTTYEHLEIQLPSVVKHDGRREVYRPEKIKTGLLKACHKRNISTHQIEEMIASIEKALVEMNEKEVSTEVIGSLIMQKLYLIDPVAYVRFASFYWDYEDIDGFIHSLKLKPAESSLGDNDGI